MTTMLYASTPGARRFTVAISSGTGPALVKGRHERSARAIPIDESRGPAGRRANGGARSRRHAGATGSLRGQVA
ncbi:hypothetical protein WME98_24570 [Sorangium sp. So ce296]|uniref:hypothetical protein n=1 Tax=Sorangium sp. So ce296 TaxID=3133296 RepID=UPI003F5E3AB6